MTRKRIPHYSYVGQRYDRLTVIELIREPQDKYNMVKCQCVCGNIKVIRESSILTGDSGSCGCLAREINSKRLKTHGLTLHPLYSILYGMKKRCYNSNNKDYHHYGGRGVTVCERWLCPSNGLQNFIEDMGPTYKQGLEIDRIDTDGNYELSNCRWADRRIQVINRRPTGSNFDTRFLEYEGKNLCISQWADEVGIPSQVLVDRLGKLGWGVEETLTTPVRPKRMFIEVDGEKYKLKDFFAANKINYNNFNNYKVDHTLEECCRKYLYYLGSYRILGEFKGKFVELYAYERQKRLGVEYE